MLPLEVIGTDPVLAFLILGLSFISAFISTTVSGGGLVQVPALIALGIPPHFVLGTVGLASIASSSFAAYQFRLLKYSFGRRDVLIAALSSAGAFVGASLVLGIDAQLIKWIVVATVLVGVAAMVARPKAGLREEGGKGPAVVIASLAIVVGVLGGMTSMAAGLLLVMLLVTVEGHSLKKAISINMLRVLGSGVATTVVFLSAGKVLFDLALVIMAGAVFGAVVGVRAAHRLPNAALKIGLAISALVLCAKLALF